MMCILSPITLIILGALQEGGAIGLTENQAGGIGITVLMLLIGGAVALFIYCGTMLERFEYIQKEPIETAYGVSGMVSERLKAMRPGHTRDMIIGITLCVLSCVPIFIPLMLNQPDWRMSAAVGATLFMIAIGVLLIVRTSIVKEGLEGLLEEGEFSRENKLEKKRNESIMTIYSPIYMPVPPDEFAVAQVKRSGTEVGEGSIERVWYASKHPLTSSFSLSVEFAHRSCRTNEEGCRLVDGNDRDRIDAFS